MVLTETLRDFARLLDGRARFVALILVGLLAVSGALEIVGLFFLFGYISVLGDLGNDKAPAVIQNIYLAIAGGFVGPMFAFVAGLVMLFVFVLKNALWLLSSFGLLRFIMKRYEFVANELFDGYQEMPLDLMQARGTLEPIQILNSIVVVFRGAFAPLLQAAADIAVILAMLVALMIVIDPVLVIASGLVLGALAIGFLSMTRKLSWSLGKRIEVAQRSQASVVNEALRGLLDVRLAGRQQVMHDRFAAVAGEFAMADRRMRALDMTPRALNEIILALGIMLAAVWFANSEGGLAGALATLAVLGFAGLRVTAAMARMTQAIQQMRQAGDSRRRLMAAIERNSPQILDNAAEKNFARESYWAEDIPFPADLDPALKQSIRLSKVKFTYPDAEAPAINGVDLDIMAGSFTAFCGPSGGGKSTIALVLMGLLKPGEGDVFCDGWDVNRHLAVWHNQIGHVGQAPFIAPKSVRENVALGFEPEQIDDAAVWRALESASVSDVFRGRPEGLDTTLGEDGALLSGGQRQRVAIARALYHEPSVLVFDEATAALDTKTERAVSKAIAELKGDRTVIAIAHRLSTIEAADVIYYVDGGKVLASGTYRELLSTSEQFSLLAGNGT